MRELTESEALRGDGNRRDLKIAEIHIDDNITPATEQGLGGPQAVRMGHIHPMQEPGSTPAMVAAAGRA